MDISSLERENGIDKPKGKGYQIQGLKEGKKMDKRCEVEEDARTRCYVLCIKTLSQLLFIVNSKVHCSYPVLPRTDMSKRRGTTHYRLIVLVVRGNDHDPVRGSGIAPHHRHSQTETATPHRLHFKSPFYVL